jgi:cell cycle checkpoint protein
MALFPSKEVLDVIVESANGDIRSAIMALQFACIVELPGSKKKGRGKGTTMVMEAVTRREQSLQLFHLLGKVLYNKRVFVSSLGGQGLMLMRVEFRERRPS